MAIVLSGKETVSLKGHFPIHLVICNLWVNPSHHTSYSAIHGCLSNTKVQGHVHSLVQPGNSIHGTERSNISFSNCGCNSLGPCFKYFKTYGRATNNLFMGLFPVFLVAYSASILLWASASPIAPILNFSICPLAAYYTFLSF